MKQKQNNNKGNKTNRNNLMEKKEMKKEQGFTLIELLIVVAIIAIIAAIAIPNLLTARMAANETGAIAGLRTLGSAQVAFSAVNNGFYAQTIGDLVTDNYLDIRYGAGANGFNGYSYSNFTPTGATPGGFVWGPAAGNAVDGYSASPLSTGTGRHTYSMGGDLVVRFETTTAANAPMCGTNQCVAGDPIGMN